MRKYGLGLGNIDWEDYARAAGYSSERQMLDDMYSNKRLSMSEIGKRLGYTKWDILYRLRKHGIERRPFGGINHVGSQLRRLRHFDQRIVLQGEPHEVARATQVSPPVLWRYRRWTQINTEWAEVYESKEKAEQRRERVKRTYRIFRERYGWWTGLSKAGAER